MATQLPSQAKFAGLLDRLKLPDTIPPFGDRLYNIYRFLWMAAFILAMLGPLIGIYQLVNAPSNNSELLLGSRAGVVVAEEDATRIRFPIGPETARAGIKPGDDIIALDGLPLPKVVPFTQRDIEKNETSLAYVQLTTLFFGEDGGQSVLTVRSPGGATRDVTVNVGEQHIAAGARSVGIAPGFLGFVDLLHAITYPFLLLAAWFLHRRQPRDPVSCILSLAILLTMAAENPSAYFVSEIVPRGVHVFIYDMGNILLLAGILLFPHGKLSARLVAVLAVLPVLLFLHGTVYKALYIAFMAIAVLFMISCLRRMQDSEVRQQIKWALFGFSGYAIFLATSLLCDVVRWQMESFGGQLILEVIAGLSLGIAFLTLQIGLLVALLRFRLYDAEFVISRSATLALMTLVTGALFAGGIQGLGDTIKSIFGSDAGAGAAGVGAAMATVLISPAHDWIHKWMEKKFHKNLLELRNGLPETVRDLREWASLPELLAEVLHRVRNGVQTVRAAIVVNGAVEGVSGIGKDEAMLWLNGFNADPEKKLCDSHDALFRVRVPLAALGQESLGWLLVGPRPDGTTVRDDEEETLVGIADPIARAIKIVLKREIEERELGGILDTLRHRIDDLEASLGGPKLKAQA